MLHTPAYYCYPQEQLYFDSCCFLELQTLNSNVLLSTTAYSYLYLRTAAYHCLTLPTPAYRCLLLPLLATYYLLLLPSTTPY